MRTTKPDAAAELRALYVRFLDASRLRDKAALDEIMTHDYTQVLTDGRLPTKEIRLRETIDRSEGTTDVLELKDCKVHFYGDSWLAFFRVRTLGL